MPTRRFAAGTRWLEQGLAQQTLADVVATIKKGTGWIAATVTSFAIELAGIRQGVIQHDRIVDDLDVVCHRSHILEVDRHLYRLKRSGNRHSVGYFFWHKRDVLFGRGSTDDGLL